jgi:hypothetical protein
MKKCKSSSISSEDPQKMKAGIDSDSSLELPSDGSDEDSQSQADDAEGDNFIEDSPCGRFSRVYWAKKFDQIIGKGAHKIVYRALDKETGCEVAWNNIGTLGMDKSRYG